MNERKYIAISVKHCFAGYTEDVNKAELYTIEEFEEEYGNELGIYNYNPLSIGELMTDFKKLKKKYDTVFVSEAEYRRNWGL